MSRILVVQPSKMLQQALAVVLASEHHVRVTGKLPESQTAPEADLAIVDAAALRDGDAAAMRGLDAIRSWRIPIVWIGAEAPPAESAPSKFVQLTPPLERESLKKALADCLGSPSSPQSPRIPNAPAAPASKESVAADDQDVIELVEVVEEQPVRDRLNAGMGKKR
ncbi:MAG TPA: hypothetical protein VIM04_03490 [Candidatus Binatia bacterium]|jgi:hypothetical protein